MVARRDISSLNHSPNHQHKPITTIKNFKQYRMYLIKNGTTEPKELVFGNVTWGDNIESLGVELNVSIPRNVGDRFLRNYDVIEIGDGVLFKNLDGVVFQGMIENIDTQRFQKDITCYDLGHLLNKTSILKQFTNVKGHDAISSVCSEQGVPVGSIEPMGVDITKIYKNEVVSDIIKDIIDQENTNTGKRLRMEFREGKLYIENQDDKVIELSYKPAANISQFDPTTVPGEISRDDSITDMRNHVKVVYEQTGTKAANARIVAEAKDDESIKKYGRRVQLESVTKEELPNAQTIANNKLRELQNVITNVTIELLGDDKLRSGHVIELNNESYGLKGKYVVLNCEHIYENNNRKMRLEIEGV